MSINSFFEAGIDKGLITNGVYFERLTPGSLAKLWWLGINIDAGGRNFSRVTSDLSRIKFKLLNPLPI